MIKVEVVRAWPGGFESRLLELAEGATVAEAMRASGIALEGVAGVAVFGERATEARALRDGERVELLGGLIADPKEARRKRAGQAGRPAGKRRT